MSSPMARLDCRDNNLNLIRCLAAIAVLVSHAWPLALGPHANDPIEDLLGRSLGHLAVLVFFVVSGYLIASSWSRRPVPATFVRARLARLLPALVVSILVTAFVLGPATTALSTGDYLAHPDTWIFLFRNATILHPQYVLPGVFSTNPYPAVEGSIRTLPYEVFCYVGILLAGVSGILGQRGIASVAIAVWVAGAATVQALGLRTIYQADVLVALSQPFALGVLVFLWRGRLPLRASLMLALLALAWQARGTAAYDLSLTAAIAYATIWIAVLPSRRLAGFNRLGDYSYGIYLYAFPIQGLAIWAIGPMTPAMNIALSLPVAAALAIVSWHWIEAPALQFAKAWEKRVTDARTSVTAGSALPRITGTG